MNHKFLHQRLALQKKSEFLNQEFFPINCRYLVLYQSEIKMDFLRYFCCN